MSSSSHRRGIELAIVVGALAFAAGCAGRSEPALPAHENLNAVLWVKTSAEYRASALQAYHAAGQLLDEALADASWTASLEQRAAGGFEALPPAVILDVDETVLDHSPYEAALIVRDTAYPDGWKEWCEEARSEPVPGALEFTRLAVSRGVAVFYVTNRDHDLEPATRRNLEARGLPVAEGYDAVLTRGEKPEWATSDKGSRRRAVAERFRILLLVGDDLGDFLSESRGTLEERAAAAAPYAAYWGRRWIVLPNPQYGSWERTLFGFERLDRSEQLRRKRERLPPSDPIP